MDYHQIDFLVIVTATNHITYNVQYHAENIGEMLEEVSSNVKGKPALQRISGEKIKGSQSDEARLAPEEL